jgi:hypothetical protein
MNNKAIKIQRQLVNICIPYQFSNNAHSRLRNIHSQLNNEISQFKQMHTQLIKKHSKAIEICWLIQKHNQFVKIQSQ